MNAPNLSANSILACLVCTELYNEKEQRPKLLQCGHTFCLRCLKEILKEARRKSTDDGWEESIQCPSCRQITALSSLNTEDLLDNFAIIGYISSSSDDQEAKFYCKKHPDERIKFFCILCQRLLCPCCALKHMSLNLLHKVVKAESAAFRYRVQIRFALDYCNEKQTLLDKIVQNSFDEKQQLAGLSLALEHLVNNASDMELLSQRQTLMQLEACAPQNQFLCTARTSGDVCTGAQMTESSRSLTPPGFWHFPSCSEENNNFSGLFRHSSSEMNLTIPSPVRQMHIQGRSHDHLVCPTGVAVTHDGFVFITDRGRQRVQVLDSSGDMLGFFRKTTETDSTELGSPAGIAISSLGYLVVIAEPHQRRVSVHARDGRRLFSLRLNWQWPFGVALNSKGQIVVTDNCENGNLYIVTVDWTNGSVLQLQTVESLKYPCFVACSKKDEIAVAINNSVRLYNTAGSLIWTSTPEQGNNCALICPKGIAIDKNSNLIVSDYSSGKVVLLSSEGRWLMNIVSSGLKGPQGLALSPNGLLVIADSQNHTIQMHSYQPASNAATSI